MISWRNGKPLERGLQDEVHCQYSERLQEVTKHSLTGIFRTYKKLSNGARIEYWYHRSTKTRLPGSYGSPEFLAAYLDAERLDHKSNETVAVLFREFLSSPKFINGKAERTTAEYRRMLRHLEAEFGSMPIRALESPKVRGAFIGYQERIGASTPREADNQLSVLSAVLSYAFDKGRISRNPISGFGRLHKADRSDIIWLEADIARFMKDAPVELQRAMILAVHTGQRYGDLIKLRWTDYQDGTLRLVQNKTKARVSIPCTAALRRMLDQAPRSSDYILNRPDGSPWFSAKDDKHLSKCWHAHMEAAGFYSGGFENLSKEEKRLQLHFHDIRGTAVTMLSEAGATIPQIVAITGHTLQSATRILERYMALTPALSKAAMTAFENSTATEFANQMQTRQT